MDGHAVPGQFGSTESGTARRRRAVITAPVGELGSTAVVAALSPKLPPFVGD